MAKEVDGAGGDPVLDPPEWDLAPSPLPYAPRGQAVHREHVEAFMADSLIPSGW